MKRSNGRRTAAAAVLVAALAVGCRPVTVTKTGGAPDGSGVRYGPTAPAPPPLGPHTPPAPSPTEHTARSATPTPEPVMAYGSQGARVRELQARLAQLGLFDHVPTGNYASVTAAAVRAFQQRQGLPRTGAVQPEAWRTLLARTHRPSPAELRPRTARPVGAADPRCLRGRVICISKRSNILAWIVDGQVVSAMDVRFGSQYTPTREGTFAVTFKSRHHVSTIYHTAMPYAMFFSGGQAVHYSADFAARGYTGASHGCVNVRDEGKIAALFGAVRQGTKVVVYH
ncbi:L,D-transpeptidase family protein [Streptomyces sp. NPDC001339]|uniref:L,D-transpeptidase family protein n=1 Tax=Streptomyces sp. NPDC001339 TaxID=3364563 RepID=UPI0036BC84F5